MRKATVSPARTPGPAAQARLVVEDIVALLIGIALLAYLLYALARPERF